MTFRRTATQRSLVSALVLAAASVGPIGCGSSDSGGSGSPTEPTLPATRAFVHVLGPLGPSQGAVPGQALLSTFEVTPPTGLLRIVATQSIDGATGVGTDPQGRFVYVGGQKGRYGYVRSYAVDGTGTLSPRSEALPPRAGGSTGPTCSPAPLAATPQELFVTQGCRGSGSYPFLVYLPDAGGVLTEGPRPYSDFDDESFWVVPLPPSPIVYADCAYYPSDGITVMSPRPDGRLGRIGLVPTPGDYGRAREAVLAGQCLVASWRTAATAQVAATGGITSYRIDPATRLPSAVGSLTGFIPIHVAAGSGGYVAVTTAETLLPYSVTASCEIQPRDASSIRVTVATDQAYAGSLAYHPSGRHLYVDQDGGLRVYAVLDSGALREIETQAGVRGRIAAAPPP